LLTRGRFGFSNTRRFFFAKNKKNIKRYRLSFRSKKCINRLVKKNLRLFVKQKNKLLLFEKFFFRGLAFSRSAAFLHRIRLRLFAKKK